MAKRRRGFTLSLVGMPGSGKTEFALRSAPRPLWVVAMDPNTRAVAESLHLRKAPDVTIQYMIAPALAFDEREDVREEAEAKWGELTTSLRPIVKEEVEARTVVLDTATELYNLGVLATFGKGDQISPEARRNMMGPVNSRWKGITSALEARGVNVILIHKGKEKWQDVTVHTQNGERTERNKMTGPFDVERDGFNGTGFMVSTEIVLAFDPNRKVKKLSGKYGMKIERSQQRPALVGREYWGRELVEGARVRRASFPFLATLLYPNSQLADWR